MFYLTCCVIERVVSNDDPFDIINRESLITCHGDCFYHLGFYFMGVYHIVIHHS
jgi:hypothetical protein